jgi:hypothetical protein
MPRQRKRASRVRPVRVFPLPEAVTGKPWTIREAGEHETPHVELQGRTMAIPIGQSGVDAWIRLHEMAHARWTPANAGQSAASEGLQHRTANACEDARIHRKLADAGFPLGSALEDRDLAKWVEHFEAGRMEPIDSARLLMAAIGTADEPAITRLVRQAGQAAVEEVVRDTWRQCFGRRRPAFPRTIEAAKILEDWFLVPPPPEVLESLGETLEGLNERGDDDGRRARGEAVWGAMRIETPALPLRLPSRVRTRKRRALAEGSFPRNWHRLASDGAVFSRRFPRLAGGAVLVDQSGSMSFEPADVLAILEAAPAAVVATYAGSAATGVLRILARDGRRCLDSEVWLTMKNNTVDGPALHWLGSQSGPRFWVSDGLATSVSGDAVRDAAKIAMRHEVVRVGDVTELLETIELGKR